MKVNWTKITDTAFQTHIPDTNWIAFLVKEEKFNRLIAMTTKNGKPVWVHREYTE